MPSSRFRGDGLDMRRPVISTHQPQQDIIDLTSDSPIASTAATESAHARANARSDNGRSSPSRSRASARPRGPRFDRNIINPIEVTADEETIDLRESSPEVQFVREQPRPASVNRPRPSHPTTQTSGFDPIRTFVNIRNGRSDVGLAANVDNNIGSAGLFLPPFPRLPPFFAREDAWPRDQLVAINFNDGHTIHDFDGRDFDSIDMDFTMQGFNLQNPSQPVQQPRPPPTYEKPPPAREGFTRDITGEDMLVCLNCEDELGVGDNDVKRQVWILKACGHVSTLSSLSHIRHSLCWANFLQVYCGECAKNRKVSSECEYVTKAQHGKPFTKCLVPDCNTKKLSQNFMQIYL